MHSGDLDQTPRSVASDLVLHCLSISHKKDTMLIFVQWVSSSCDETYVLRCRHFSFDYLTVICTPDVERLLKPV